MENEHVEPDHNDSEASDLISISALNDFLYCARRAALHHLEGIFIHNPFTLEGSLMHRHVNGPFEERRGSLRIVYGLPIYCRTLGLVGKADAVEFRSDPDNPEREIPYPVEYKRGRCRRWDNDDVQVCAQALCLEEMLGIAVPAGAIYHWRSRCRREVPLDDALRAKTIQAAVDVRALLSCGHTPPALRRAQCKDCSLRSVCIPELTEDARRSARAHNGLFKTSPGGE
jgi:CRISPR-associated exonuclease Cas4